MMRIDVISIFPAYLDALQLSLAGKAQAAGLLNVKAHDLREFTGDKHRSVDDTPYGGGAGMVMKPEPWGEALDAVTTDAAVIIVPLAGRGDLARRLRPQWGRGSHPGDDRSRRTPRPGLHEQPRVADRGVARRGRAA